MTFLREIARSPGDQTIEHEIETHPAEQHAPERSEAEEAEDIDPARPPKRRQQFILFRMLAFDVLGLGFVDGRLLARIVTDVPVGEQAGRNRTHAGDDKGRAPGLKDANQRRDDQPAKRRAQGRAAIDEHGAATALFRGHPDRVQLAAGRKRRTLGHPQSQSRDQQRKKAGRERSQGKLWKAPHRIVAPAMTGLGPYLSASQPPGICMSA